jgi:hypothetical protein
MNEQPVTQEEEPLVEERGEVSGDVDSALLPEGRLYHHHLDPDEEHQVGGGLPDADHDGLQ